MTRLKVFIASSSEGLEVADTIRGHLLQELGEKAEIKPWKWEFELSENYIESLEIASADADFAIIVLTPDDVTTSREKKMLAPRDNVIFELGLFMGCLGRKRCFIVKEKSSNIKIPTDLLNVQTATFKRPLDNQLKSALAAPCYRIKERINKFGIRYKLNPEVIAAQATIRSFCDSVQGAWWERIIRDDLTALSFFKIAPDERFNSIRLKGKAYDKEGLHSANWKSVIVRVISDENKILYQWEGWHTKPDLAHVTFHGFGEMEFDKTAYSSATINRGGGKFWDINEAHPERTVVKPTELRRVLEKSAIDTIGAGTRNEIRSLIMKTLRQW